MFERDPAQGEAAPLQVWRAWSAEMGRRSSVYGATRQSSSSSDDERPPSRRVSTGIAASPRPRGPAVALGSGALTPGTATMNTNSVKMLEDVFVAYAGGRAGADPHSLALDHAAWNVFCSECKLVEGSTSREMLSSLFADLTSGAADGLMAVEAFVNAVAIIAEAKYGATDSIARLIYFKIVRFGRSAAAAPDFKKAKAEGSPGLAQGQELEAKSKKSPPGLGDRAAGSRRKSGDGMQNARRAGSVSSSSSSSPRVTSPATSPNAAAPASVRVAAAGPDRSTLASASTFAAARGGGDAGMLQRPMSSPPERIGGIVISSSPSGQEGLRHLLRQRPQSGGEEDGGGEAGGGEMAVHTPRTPRELAGGRGVSNGSGRIRTPASAGGRKMPWEAGLDSATPRTPRCVCLSVSRPLFLSLPLSLSLSLSLFLSLACWLAVSTRMHEYTY